jgi:protein required for attachment to host cells
MTRTKTKADEWVVVCDGRKALILENTGSDLIPKLRSKEVREHEEAKTSELGTDRPGRVQQSVGSANAAVEQTDWHEEAERLFLRELTERLDAALTHHEAASFVVVAPPRALGILRKLYPAAVHKAIRRELQRDLVRQPIVDIERELAAA